VPLRHRPHRVLYVPLDDRPVNLKMPQLLAQMVEYELPTPPVELLGNFHTPGQPEEIAAWLQAQVAEPVDCVILSLDMLAYGGLLASRQMGTSPELAQQRLAVLSRLRQIAPEVAMYAHSVIMGQAPTAVADDTSEYRHLLGEYSRLKALVTEEGRSAPRAALAELESRIPAAMRDRYSAARERNHQINRLAVEQVAAGNIDFLALPQDDAEQQGLHIAEQQRLKELISERGVEDRVMMYPGADEVGMTLLARFIHQHMEKQPAIRMIYTDEAAAQNVAQFEDRPFTETVAAQLAVLGARLATDDEDADLTLLVNPPAGVSRQEARQQAVSGERQQQIAQMLQEAIQRSSGRGIAICDAAFPNGAEDVLVEAVMDSGVELPQLLSFGAWNTAGNTVGSVLAHGTLRLTALQDKGAFDLVHLFTSFAPMRYLELLNSLINAQRAHIQFLFTRFVDDWLYQPQVRPVVTREFTQLVCSSAFDLGDSYFRAEQMVRNRLTEAATNLWIERFLDKPCVEIGAEDDRSVLMLAEMAEMHAVLPWRRLFEVDLEFALNMELVAKS